jgi:hypothetical protein
LKLHYLCIANGTSTPTNLMATKEQVEGISFHLAEYPMNYPFKN